MNTHTVKKTVFPATLSQLKTVVLPRDSNNRNQEALPGYISDNALYLWYEFSIILPPVSEIDMEMHFLIFKTASLWENTYTNFQKR